MTTLVFSPAVQWVVSSKNDSQTIELTSSVLIILIVRTYLILKKFLLVLPVSGHM